MIVVINHVDRKIEITMIRIWNLDTKGKGNQVRLTVHCIRGDYEKLWMLENGTDRKTDMNRLTAYRWPPGGASEWRVLARLLWDAFLSCRGYFFLCEFELADCVFLLEIWNGGHVSVGVHQRVILRYNWVYIISWEWYCKTVKLCWEQMEWVWH